MRHELDERCTESDLLQSKLNKLKENNAQSLVKIEDKWKKRHNEQCMEHEEVSFDISFYL